MPRNCMIISGGDFSPIPAPRPDDYVIACDRGYSYAVSCGIHPDLVVGDFDSYDGSIDSNVPVNRFPPEKDDTDTILAVRRAAELGVESVSLYCALGGRMDHTVANLQALIFAQNLGMGSSIHSANTMIHTLKNGSMRLPRRYGWTLSVFSAQDMCYGVNISGVKYPLHNATLSNSYPLGISNEWISPEAFISVEKGILLIVESEL